MTTRYRLQYLDQKIGTFETDPLEGWDGTDKLLEATDTRGRTHRLNIGPGIAVRSESFKSDGDGRKAVFL